MAWTNELQPTGPNHYPLLTGTSLSDGKTAVPVSVDPTTGAILTSGSGGTQYTDGATAVTHPIGTQPVFTNGSNIVTAVSTANPLPITGTISVGSTTDDTAFTAGTSTTAPAAGVYNDSLTALVSGYQGTFRSTAYRGLHINLRNNSGTEIGTSSTPLQVSLANTASNATAVKVDGSAVTQPISAASLPLPTGAATSANQTNASQKTQIVDGSGNVISSTSNALNVNIANEDLVDNNNSTTSTLTANSIFTGTGSSTLNYAFILVYVYSNVSSATNGLTIQFSSDNTNWNDASAFTFTSGGTTPNNGQTYGAPVRGQYYRVVYTNGGTNQTTFRLQSILKDHSTGGDMVTMSNVPNSTNHALLTKSSIVGLTTAGGGGYVDVKVNPSGSLTTASNIFDSNGSNIVLGQTTMSASLPVAIASNQSAIPVTESGTWNVGLNAGTNAIGSITNTSFAATQSGSWSVTANAGTNLNTSALALESGGNLAAIKTDLDTIKTNTAIPSALVAFLTTVTTAGTRVQLASNSIVGGVIEADGANTGYVYVGGSTVSSTSWGAKLAPGQSTGIALNNTNLIYVDADTNGNKVGFIGS